jgi:hypothetical protein
MLGPEPSYEVTLDFPLSERQRLALYLVRHRMGPNVVPKLDIYSNLANLLGYCAQFRALETEMPLIQPRNVRLCL